MTQNYLPYVFLAFIGIAEKAFLPDFIFQGHEQMGPLTTRYFVSKGTSTALTFVFVHSFADIYWIPALDILSGAIALIWSFLSARKLFGTGITFVSLQETLEEIKTSGLYCFSSMSAAIFTSFTTLFIGFAISDAAQISYWSIAMTAVSAVQSLYTPIINSLYPHILVTKDYRFVKKLILLSIAPVTIGSICFALLHNVLMSIIGGSAYMAGSWVFIAVTPVVFSSFYSMLLGWPIMGTYGLIKEVTATAVVSGIFCILALVIGYFIIEMNLYYVCAIRCITEFIMAGLRGIFSFKVLRKEAA
jgi:PST family polysaccharide transporter